MGNSIKTIKYNFIKIYTNRNYFLIIICYQIYFAIINLKNPLLWERINNTQVLKNFDLLNNNLKI